MEGCLKSSLSWLHSHRSECRTYRYRFIIISLFIASHISISAGRSTAQTLHYVPSAARPGYIVTSLHRGQHQLSEISGGDRARRFSIDGDHLAVNSDLTHLAGNEVALEIKHHTPGSEPWVELVRVLVGGPSVTAATDQFTHQPYVGLVAENTPGGSHVAKLEGMFTDMRRFSYGCQFSLTGHDSAFLLLSDTSLVTTVPLDHEETASLHVIIMAMCTGGDTRAVLAVQVVDLNDNEPQFDRPMYVTTWDPTQGDHVMVVTATDADQNQLHFSLSDTDTFRIDPVTGVISARAGNYDDITSYELLVYANDGEHTTHTLVRVIVKHAQPIRTQNDIVARHRRAVRETIKLVVRQSDTGDLFTVTSLSQYPGERYEFREPAPEGLVINEEKGIVSLQDAYVWDTTVSHIEFIINVTRDDSSTYQEDQAVWIQLVDRSWEESLFTNRPREMWATVPEWIRPDSTIYQVVARDLVEYDVPVKYMLESDSSGGCFRVDERTGEVQVNCRRQFPEGAIYQLAISAQSRYAAHQMATPTQVLRVHVGALKPQFHLSPYFMNMPETTDTDDKMSVEAVSFQRVPIKFSITEWDTVSKNVFSIRDNGELRLLRKLRHVSDPQQYRMKVKVTEEYTNLETTTELIINLIGENINNPFFPARVYVVKEIDEDLALGQEVTRVRAVDIDKGVNGQLTFTVDDDHFSAEVASDGKTAIIRVADRLDYDLTDLHRYRFTLTATDGGPEPRSGSTLVEIWLNNVNDEEPVMEPPIQIVRVKEDAIQGLRIHTVQAFDLDGQVLSFTFRGGSSLYRDFNIDRLTGAITLREEIQPGTGDLDLPIDISDGTSITQGVVKVKFIGVNHPPRFPNCDAYTGTARLLEEEDAGSLVINMLAVDDDSGENGELDFKVVFTAAQEKSLFMIGGEVTRTNDEYSLQLISNVKFDHEDPLKDVAYVNGNQNYKVTVLAEDNGTPKLAASCFLFVKIKDINDKIPRFDEIKYSTIVMEDVTRFSRVIQVFAVDDDDGDFGTVSYNIERQDNGCGGCFSIDTRTGWITRSGSGSLVGLNRVTLVVTAQDTMGHLSSEHEVVIDITDDVSLLAPTFLNYNGQSLDDTQLFVDEDIDKNIAYLQVFTNKNSLPSVQNGRTVMENYNRNFERKTGYNETSMTIYADGLDYSLMPQYSVRVRAALRDGTYFTDARVKVTVRDVNNKIPVFEGLDDLKVYPAAVTEKTEVGDVVVKVTAIDGDGISPNNLVTYHFLDECPDCRAFGINRQTGAITAAQRFNPGEVRSYILRVVAEDGALSSTGSGFPNKNEIDVTVKVTGPSLNPPYFPQDLPAYTINLDEGATFNTTVTTRVVAIDPLPGENVIQYVIVGGNEDRRFACDSITGRIYTVGDISYNTKQSYDLVFGVFDGIQINTTNIKINIQPQNIHPPDFSDIDVEVNNIFENDESISIANPKFLIQVEATDVDVGSGAIRYRLDGEYYNRDRFSIYPNGSIYLKRPLDRDYPDGTDDWLVNVVANDQGAESLSGYGMLHLKLQDQNDNSPVFDNTNLVGRVRENSNLNAFVMQLSAVDYDSGRNGQIVYEKGDVWPQTEAGSDLFMLSSTGRLTTALSRTLDREDTDRYTAVVRAIDGGSPSQTVEQVIDIEILDENDNPPRFDPSRYIHQMPEGLPVGAPVMSVFAADADTGENARLVYRILSPGADELFYMDSLYSAQAGLIRIREPIDYEMRTSYNIDFTVQVRDSDLTHTDTATVTIEILDINDNPPVFSQPLRMVNITENTDVAIITTYTATDADSGINSDFKFFIDYELSEDIDRRFLVNQETGELTLIRQLDRETKPIYYLHVLAIDEGEPAMTGTTTLTVYVEDQNDNAPDIGQVSTPRPVVGPDTPAGSEVLRFALNDPDIGGVAPRVTYVCNDARCNDFEFQQISSSGVIQGIIRTKKSGYTTSDLGSDHYDLTFELEDGAGLTRTRVISIYVAGDPSERFVADTSYITVYNYMARLPDTDIGQVYCGTDDNNWTPEGKQFTAYGGTYAYFDILNNGSIIMRKGAPRGNQTLEVTVLHTATKQSAICKVVVHIYYIYEDAFKSAGSVRIEGTNVVDFISQPPSKGPSQYTQLQGKLATLIGTQSAYVEIFSARDVEGADVPTIDVYYAAHGSPYYRSARLNGLVWANKDNLLSGGLVIKQAPVSLCATDPCYSGGCTDTVVTTGNNRLVTSSRTTFVGIDVWTAQECVCADRLPASLTGDVPQCDKNSCLNGGTCVQNYVGYECACLAGFEGPNCEQTKLTFNSDAWAWFNPIMICDQLKLSFEFRTLQATALLLYNGPMYDTSPNDLRDFISVELFGGYPRIRVNTGNLDDVVLFVDGMNSQDENVISVLNDGKWHTVELFKDGPDYMMVVDHCRSSIVAETMEATATERQVCESHGYAMGADHFLTVNTPLELGGRAKPANYPPGLAGNSFNGCMKNLWINGQLYDLHVGEVGESRNTIEGCNTDGCDTCTGNATCSGTIGGNSECTCLPGYMGAACDKRTPLKDFYSEKSFIEWQLTSGFNRSMSAWEGTLQITFRTRQMDGVLFYADSFSTLERIIIEIVSTHVQFRYDLGAGDQTLGLPMANVSDGAWHTVTVSRYGNQVILRLDNGEGEYYAESWPSDKMHRLMALRGSMMFGAAQVSFNPWSGQAYVDEPLSNTCVMDVRYNGRWFPMDRSSTEPTEATVERLVDADDDCDTDVCGQVACPFGSCLDIWRQHTCVCGYGEMVIDSVCVTAVDCSIDRCVHGDCVIIDEKGAETWRCNCYEGYQGPYCNGTVIEPGAATAGVSDGMVAIIVVCLLILLLAIILIIVFMKRRRPAYLLEDEDDVRETVRNYDEEGAGEEDTHGYDLSRLPKPVDPNRDFRSDDPDRPYLRVEEPPPVPEPQVMPPLRSRPQFADPSDYPNVGDFIGDRLGDANDDPNAPPYDSVREYEYEGGGSTVGSLSSLQSSSSGDQDFDYLRDFGPPFRKLADMYGGGDEAE